MLALYAAWPTWPCDAAPDAVLTITPRSPVSASGSFVAMRAAASRITLNVPVRFTAITESHVASGNGLPRETVFAAVATPAAIDGDVEPAVRGDHRVDRGSDARLGRDVDRALGVAIEADDDRACFGELATRAEPEGPTRNR